ncbi:hypothetical protein [Paenacidovorax monticola]|uniref:hypothetical protein n=1 Tax=Paenacidovorax monticola TaxID=1926868 RepID=UPI00336A099D
MLHFPGFAQARRVRHGQRPRLNRFQAHHEERLREVKAQSERCGVSAREVMKGMFRRELGLHEQTFALGEALAHLH